MGQGLDILFFVVGLLGVLFVWGFVKARRVERKYNILTKIKEYNDVTKETDEKLIDLDARDSELTLKRAKLRDILNRDN